MSRRLFERLDRPGGHAITVEDTGYRFDRTGHLLHLRDPEIRKRSRSPGIGDDVLEIERRSLIWSNGVYTRYPFQANTFGLPPARRQRVPARLLAAHFAKPARPPENFEEFCLATFGEGFCRAS